MRAVAPLGQGTAQWRSAEITGAAPLSRSLIGSSRSTADHHAAARRSGQRDHPIRPPSNGISLPTWADEIFGKRAASCPRRSAMSQASGRPGAVAASGGVGPAVRQPAERGVTGASLSGCPQPDADPSGGGLPAPAAIFGPGIVPKRMLPCWKRKPRFTGEPQPALAPGLRDSSGRHIRRQYQALDNCRHDRSSLREPQ
jgi:hypothetical protein